MPAQTKPVYFNYETERELLDFARTMPSFSNWVKEKLRAEMEKQKKITWKLPNGNEVRV